MKTKILFLVLAMMMMGACAKKKSSSPNTRAMSRTSQNNTAGAPGTTSCSATSWGRIYNQSSDVNSFTQMLIQFTGDANLGSVDPNYYSTTTGVDLQMTAAFSGQQFVTGNSRLLIKIIDSYATPQSNYIEIRMNAQSGQATGPGSFRASYVDNAGTVTLQGQRTTISGQSYVYGSASFQNNNGDSGVMGEFLIGSCALVGI